jgi:hypothetical protein
MIDRSLGRLGLSSLPGGQAPFDPSATFWRIFGEVTLLYRVRNRHWRTTGRVDRSTSYVRRTSCPCWCNAWLYWHVSSVDLQDATNAKKKLLGSFLPTAEVEDDPWWLGSRLILRTVNLFIHFHSWKIRRSVLI